MSNKQSRKSNKDTESAEKSSQNLVSEIMSSTLIQRILKELDNPVKIDLSKDDDSYFEKLYESNYKRYYKIVSEELNYTEEQQALDSKIETNEDDLLEMKQLSIQFLKLFSKIQK